MPCRSRSHHRLSRLATAVLALAATLALVSASVAAPTLGFVETFPGTSLSGWDGGAAEVNPGTGGTGGATDGYLRFSTPNGTVHNLGADSGGLEYVGNWTAAGITQVRIWLNDVGTDDPLEMHFVIGKAFTNVWQYNIAFLPPLHQWAEFVVDLSSSANWTQTQGAGTFAQALQDVDRVHVRHDKAPFVQGPDPLDGDVGLDHVLLTNGNVGVEPIADGPRALALAAPAPNPSRGDVLLSLETFEADAVRLEVVDAAGRIVRHAVVTSAGAATLHWSWNGRGDDGRPTPAGYYNVRAIGRTGGASCGLVRVR
jgi:FlgD Ig-like domain